MKPFIYCAALLTLFAVPLIGNPSRSQAQNEANNNEGKEPFNYHTDTKDNRELEPFNYPDAPIYFPPYSDTNPDETKAMDIYRANQYPP